MTKSELTRIIWQQNPDLLLKDVDVIVSEIMSKICGALIDGQRVEIRGFGTFSIKNRKPRFARDPRNGRRVKVQEKWVPAFRTAKKMNEKINQPPKDV